MGARLARMFRNYNVENRALREISKEKPRSAPRHATTATPSAVSSEVAELVMKKNESLLEHLRSVYVESTDPTAAPEVRLSKEADRRPLRVSLPGSAFGLPELTDVPKGKLTLAEALTALGSHQHQPRTWSAEKIAQEYCLELQDTKSVVEFFIPFKVEIIPPKSRTAKQIKVS
uniref:NADH dehydrogenase [ubiquinone] 1 alpha subcomplex assembly factor 4 n=1 Tax=Xiphophorus couchianus TaxID=32473 RepID=A0A3B5KMA4_9TELE